jgi:hypothetical protein
VETRRETLRETLREEKQSASREEREKKRDDTQEFALPLSRGEEKELFLLHIVLLHT